MRTWMATCWFENEGKTEQDIKEKIEQIRLAGRLAIEEVLSEVGVDIETKIEVKEGHSGALMTVVDLHLPAALYNRKISCMVREQAIEEYRTLANKIASNIHREYDKTNT